MLKRSTNLRRIQQAAFAAIAVSWAIPSMAAPEGRSERRAERPAEHSRMRVHEPRRERSFYRDRAMKLIHKARDHMHDFLRGTPAAKKQYRWTQERRADAHRNSARGLWREALNRGNERAAEKAKRADQYFKAARENAKRSDFKSFRRNLHEGRRLRTEVRTMLGERPLAALRGKISNYRTEMRNKLRRAHEMRREYRSSGNKESLLRWRLNRADSSRARASLWEHRAKVERFRAKSETNKAKRSRRLNKAAHLEKRAKQLRDALGRYETKHRLAEYRNVKITKDLADSWAKSDSRGVPFRRASKWAGETAGKVAETAGRAAGKIGETAGRAAKEIGGELARRYDSLRAQRGTIGRSEYRRELKALGDKARQLGMYEAANALDVASRGGKHAETAERQADRLLASAARQTAHEEAPKALPAPSDKAASEGKSTALVPYRKQETGVVPYRDQQRERADSEAPQVADAEQPGGAKPKAEQQPKRVYEPSKRERVEADYGKLKKHLKLRDLGSAFAVLKAMERETAEKGGIGNKFKLWKAKRKMRRAAEKLGKQAIRDGGAAADVAFREGKSDPNSPLAQERRAIAEHVQKLRENGLTAEQHKQILKELDEMNAVSNYTTAREVLDHLGSRMKKHGLARRVISKVAGLVVGAIARTPIVGRVAAKLGVGNTHTAHRTLDRELLSEAKYLRKRGIDGAMAARLLLSEARSRGMGKTKLPLKILHSRYHRTAWRAERALKKIVKDSKKIGDVASVEKAYELKAAYQIDKLARKGKSPEEYEMSDRLANKMEKDIATAEVNLIKTCAKVTKWILKNPQMAQQYGWDISAAETVNAFGTESAKRLVEKGFDVPDKYLDSLAKNHDMIHAKEPGLLKRLWRSPLNVLAWPFRVGKFVFGEVLNPKMQWRAMKNQHLGNSTPPPIDPQKMDYLMRVHLARHAEMNGRESGPGQQVFGPEGPQQAQAMNGNPMMR